MNGCGSGKWRHTSSVMHWNCKQPEYKTPARAPCAVVVAVMISLRVGGDSCHTFVCWSFTPKSVQALPVNKRTTKEFRKGRVMTVSLGLQKEAKLPKSRAGRSEPSLSSEQITCRLLWNKTSNMWNKSELNYMIRPLNVKQDAHQVRAYKNLTNLFWLIFLLLANCFAV